MVNREASIKETSEYAISLAQNGDVEAGLRVIYNSVEQIVTEPLCTAQVFASNDLDKACQAIGQISLRKLGITLPVKKVQRDKALYVYIVTRIQKSGGHTRVIQDFIKARPDAHHSLILTELAGPSDVEFISQGLMKKQPGISIEAAQGLGFHDRLAWLQKRLAELAPDHFYLFNHHQDSVAVAAVQPEMGLTGSFYHHGDHHLCLGVTLSFIGHIDIHQWGHNYCRHTLGLENTYVPLTVDDRGALPNNWAFMPQGRLTTCTVGRHNKVEAPYFIRYVELVPQLLKATGGTHVHIGQLTFWGLRRIRQGLKKLQVNPDRFVYVPWVPSVWEALQKYKIDFCIASFPYGGGITLIEIMGAGVPVAIHRHIYSRLLSTMDMAYPDVFTWRYPEELFAYCKTLTPAILQLNSQKARQHYEKHHRPSILADILNNKSKPPSIDADFSTGYDIKYDEWGKWMEGQLNLGRLAYRSLYRAYLRLRAWKQRR